MRCLLLASLLIAAPVAANPPAAQASAEQQAATPAADPDAGKLICVRTRVTGSLTRTTKDCRTRAQWDRMAERTQKQMRDEMLAVGGAVPRDN
jgi:hypothetical protein